MKTLVIFFVVLIALVGCNSSGNMSKAEVQNFAPPKGQPRSAQANQQIADFKKRFEEKHGRATNAPPNIPASAGNAPAANVGG